MSIYQDIILDHFRAPRNFGHLKKGAQNVEVSNPLCGDQLRIEAVLKENKLVDVAFSGKGCAISIASASLLTEFIKGKSKEELQKIDRNSIINMLGIELGPVRIKCALLSLEGLRKLLIENE